MVIFYLGIWGYRMVIPFLGVDGRCAVIHNGILCESESGLCYEDGIGELCKNFNDAWRVEQISRKREDGVM
jgi:hypothetical protein